MSGQTIPTFNAATIEAVAAILGETDLALKNAEIERVLAGSNIPDPLAEAKAANPQIWLQVRESANACEPSNRMHSRDR